MNARILTLFFAILAAVLFVADDGRSVGAQEGGPKEATLAIDGEPGTEFSGSCAVGGAKDDLGGRVPQRISYKFVGEKLECEVHQQSEGVLEVILESGDDRSEQRISSQGGTIKLAYSEDSISSSTTTSSSGSVVSQQSSSSSSSSSSQTQQVIVD